MRLAGWQALFCFLVGPSDRRSGRHKFVEMKRRPPTPAARLRAPWRCRSVGKRIAGKDNSVRPAGPSLGGAAYPAAYPERPGSRTEGCAELRGATRRYDGDRDSIGANRFVISYRNV